MTALGDEFYITMLETNGLTVKQIDPLEADTYSRASRCAERASALGEALMQKAQHREQIKGQVITSSMREASTQMARSERATPLEIYKLRPQSAGCSTEHFCSPARLTAILMNNRM